MAEPELKMEEGGKKRKLIIIIAVAVILLAGGGAAAFFLLGDSDEIPVAATQGSNGGAANTNTVQSTGMALYVAMPRPFVFNVPGATRDRLVEIKVQLMLRGFDNEELVKMHIPSIEGVLLRVFSTANADDLVTEAGKKTIRDSALKEVQKKMQELTGGQFIEAVLFTGFVMQ